jgi:uncharacterized protein YjbI with pentapeptide repeats
MVLSNPRTTTNRRKLALALFAIAAFAFQSATSANASPLVAGGSYQNEDHSGEGHSREVLDGIDLSFGSFANTILRRSSFIAAVFEQTDFSGANLGRTNLQNADLTNATFSPGTNLRRADLTSATLIGIDLTGVDVRNAIFVGATYDSSTILPFDPVGAGMVLVPEMSPLTLIMLGLLIFAALKCEEKHEDLRSPVSWA